MSKEITDIDFKKEVIDSDKIILIDFWAPWCVPCLQQKSILEKLEKEYKGKIRFLNINIDKNQVFASRYLIMNIPNCLIFKDGKPIEQIVGLVSTNKLREALDRILMEG